jgi:hypothetical protein
MLLDSNHIKHEIEDQKSWDLYQNRKQGDELHLRKLMSEGVKGTKQNRKQGIPRPKAGTFHAMMIDAGSQGTRIHLYEFEDRVLDNKHELRDALNGYKLSLPTTNSRWTNRLHPGLDSLASINDDIDLLQELKKYLKPLFDFTKSVLIEKEEEWSNFPIYLKATGGLRTLGSILL